MSHDPEPLDETLVVILGDQLSPSLAALKAAVPGRDRVLMAEVMAKATYVRHHKKKIAFLFSAMRHFSRDLRAAGWNIDYVEIDDPRNSGSIAGEIERAVDDFRPERVVVTEPGEWRLRNELEQVGARLAIPLDILEDGRFLCSHAEFSDWAAGRKQLRMEHFYREMRRKTGLLMSGDKPLGGQWNFDRENRKPPPEHAIATAPLRYQPDGLTQRVISVVGARFADHFGDIEPFWFAVTTDQTQAALDHFVDTALPNFGHYQDAMLSGEKYLYHGVISHYINAGLLDPLDVCRKAEAAYVAGQVPLNAAEGFIRQIIGWREYVRGIYWMFMPDYLENNHLSAERPLPSFYWTGNTDMDCLKAAITQTREEAYAHHIQRLMVTGNFAMLAGIDPKEVHAWYLAVYADAYEWVELPNTLGMSQFADGGLLAFKPYAASGSYINRMSDYCSGCRYDVKRKTGPGACPLNALYWDFLVRNEDKLRGNPRLGPVYRNWDRMSADKQAEYRDSAARTLAALDGAEEEVRAAQ